jgi:signal transduction histidine kinase/HD-like signal output (HDOD) protein
MKSKEQLFSNIQRSLPLPSLPHILVKLIDVCDDEDIPISMVAPLVAQDTSLSVTVLRLVNSTYFGLNRTFSNLGQAVVYLGASTIKNLAVTASVEQVFKGLGNGKSFRIGEFWYHSLLCATLGKRIAKAANYTNVEEAYLSGLLHNIGHLLLFANFPEESALIRAEQAKGAECCAEEELQIGITHCEAGFRLLKEWKIGPFIADTALYHHGSVEQIQEGFPLVKIIYLANQISELEEAKLYLAYRQGRDLLGLDRAQMLEIVEGAKEEVIEIAQELDVNIKIPKAAVPVVPKNGKQHRFLHKEGSKDESSAFLGKNQELARQIKKDSLLTGFLKKLIQTEGENSTLAATEEIIRILFACKTVFFLLYDSDTKRLMGHTSTENSCRELVQDLILPVENSTSTVLRALTENRIQTFFQGEEQSTNLADVQLFNVINGKGIMYLPMLVKQEQVGVIVLNVPEENKKDVSRHHKQLQLIADQTAISLHLDNMKQKEAHKLQVERMATATLAARKIVHEVNNPLGIMSNYLKLLEIKLPDNTEVQQELQILGEEITRVSTIIGQLSDLTTSAVQQVEKVNVNELINSLIGILDVSLLASADIKVLFSPDPLLVEFVTEKDTLKQIIINLVKNSAEAIESDGSITITTKSKVGKNGSGRAIITLSDDGPGIPEEIQEKLFAPFMTTKEQGHSGLGLSIVHKAVHDLGGTIECESSREKGTHFTISLPFNRPEIDNQE